ncbi:hypothetical protein FGE12_25770 [Aggregicoccus sp. 17bor-14]|uniref:hypothetical protein n=1 Tax=Myxococcaceae TaxID=31 RepID=UPI00129CBCC5|nr:MULTISPECIES: hypothetical protein [Myxococcaceae]MBF5045844.1 hypothetical protein [Simulacricoccus sp. 17bor-14]MRI91578.1 hypothetical protein [Aggregicoccus sp. 17bor-14]
MKAWAIAVLAVGASACSGTGSGVRAEADAPRIGATSSEDLVVGARGVVGRTTDLRVSESSMRGRFREVPVDLSWNGQYLKGVVGGQLTRLELAQGDDTRLLGSFAGMPVDLVIEKGGLSGRVGECHYALFRVKGGFRGPTACGGARQRDSELAFSEELTEKPLGQQAALLALTLSPHLERRYMGVQRPVSWTVSDQSLVTPGYAH